MEDKNYLTEAFKAFEGLEKLDSQILEEDIFNISYMDGLEKAKEFADEVVEDDEEEIIDTDAETEEEVKDDYIGKAILECAVCGSLIYKEPSEVIINEELELANVGEPCPVCQSEDGYIVVGEIKPFCDDEECEEHKEDEEPVEEVEETEEEIDVEEDDNLDESIKTRKRVRISEEKPLEEAKPTTRKGGSRNIDKIRKTLAMLGESSERDKIDAEKDNKIEKARKTLSRKLDDADSLRDERKKSAKKSFRKAQDDADADRDYKLKRKGLKESKGVREIDVRPGYHEWVITVDDTPYYSFGDFIEILDNYTNAEDFANDLLDDFKEQTNEYFDRQEDIIDFTDYAKEIGKLSEDERANVYYGLVNAYNYYKGIDESCNKKKSKKSLKESDKPAATSIEDAQKWVDYDMKKYGKISERTNRLVKKAGFQILKDDHGDYEVAAGKFESYNEDFQKVDIETDREKMTMTAEENGKVTVTTEPIENVEEVKEEETEVIAPISAEVEDEFKSSEDEETEDEYTDVEFDEFDEEEFDTLGENYLRKVYENVKSFKTTGGSINGNQLRLEGLITFKSGKVGKTNFVFESYKATKTGKLKFIGENKQFAQGKKSFVLTGRVNENKLICESLTYNYSAKAPSGNTKRLYGTIRK